MKLEYPSPVLLLYPIQHGHFLTAADANDGRRELLECGGFLFLKRTFGYCMVRKEFGESDLKLETWKKTMRLCRKAVVRWVRFINSKNNKQSRYRTAAVGGCGYSAPLSALKLLFWYFYKVISGLKLAREIHRSIKTVVKHIRIVSTLASLRSLHSFSCYKDIRITEHPLFL